jgi:GTPase SAR1 family protein
MQGEIEKIKQFVKWYEETARPFLLKTAEEKVADFDRDNARLSKAVKSFDVELAVCFLGSSGVGKSTLINSLLGGEQAVVPSGGVGPLTAQAVVVRHQETPGIEVEYHKTVTLRRTGLTSCNASIRLTEGLGLLDSAVDSFSILSQAIAPVHRAMLR